MTDWALLQYRNFPYSQFLPFNGQPQPFNSHPHPFNSHAAMPEAPPCNCIKMRECAPLMTKLVTAPLPLPMTLVKDLRKTSCGYDGIHPMVCCPYGIDIDYRRQVTTEKPWIWGVVEKTTTQPSKTQWRPNKQTKYLGPKLSKKKHYFFEFEDPRTSRNCPPSFSPDFNMPNRFKNTPPVRNVIPSRINVDGPSPADTSTVRSTNEDIEPNLIFSSSNDARSTAIVFPTSVPSEKEHLINPKHCGVSINSRIIGGEDAGPGQFPW